MFGRFFNLFLSFLTTYFLFELTKDLQKISEYHSSYSLIILFISLAVFTNLLFDFFSELYYYFFNKDDD